MAWIYKIVLKTGETYVGQTKNSMSSRMVKHRNEYKTRPNKFVYKRIKEEGGWENVMITPIVECFEKDLDELEKYYIQQIPIELQLNTQHGERYHTTYSRRPDIDFKQVSQEYINGASIKSLARKYKCDDSTISNNLKKLNVEPRPAKEILKKDFLYTEYIINQKSSLTIARETGYTKARILQLLRQYNIPRRNANDAVYKRKLIDN